MSEPATIRRGSLAHLSCLPEHSRGRRHPETEHVYRTPFERDRDRVIHCAAFRRLEFKTQVFAYFESDYVRNRLTHTLEVSQIARSVCRTLGLNVDLCEAVALSHDLGHPPFGHAGERALQRLAADAGGFNHNLQGLRIVDELEERYGDFPGLNLSYEVREGFAKHGSGRAAQTEEFFASGPQAVLEAQLVDMVDELAYTSHDIDDGLVHGRLDLSDLAQTELWAGPFAEVTGRFPEAPSHVIHHETVRRVINRLVTDLMTATQTRALELGLCDYQAVREHAEPVVTFSPDVGALLREMRTFLIEHLYRDYRVVQMNQKADRIVSQLFETLVAEPRQLPRRQLDRCETEGVQRVVVDYLSGMTDKFALETHHRLFGSP